MGLLRFAIDAITHQIQDYFDLYTRVDLSGILLCSRRLKMALGDGPLFDPANHPHLREPTEAEKSLKSVPYDPRFPNQNQTKNCWQNYVDFYRCQNLKGEDYKPCQFFFKNFMTLCPLNWIEKWNDQRENGTFPAKLG